MYKVEYKVVPHKDIRILTFKTDTEMNEWIKRSGRLGIKIGFTGPVIPKETRDQVMKIVERSFTPELQLLMLKFDPDKIMYTYGDADMFEDLAADLEAELDLTVNVDVEDVGEMTVNQYVDSVVALIER